MHCGVTIADSEKITSDYLNAFDKLIDAYGRIAETMPRLNHLGGAFKDSPALLTKLALYYVDVLEFHRRAYKFVRRKCMYLKDFWLVPYAYSQASMEVLLCHHLG